ncbi:1-acyl-sn-glycerol-3-phosphate acyltransferase [Desulfobotulus sp. H1]|uniref:1-acyl-sn-glycerol-3-phosphate acyltransferase n=1 Tax=Desulfobotulus pelophilus TaxID=2823377 RepID=A0ABT3N772_9BACT|nr:1-acyl-sn-glycerol-3-phosphate acyltransferase [Desulfobotulus pelophilus]
MVTGKEHIDKKATYVVVSNHQSQLDILAAFRTFFHFKWVSKIEVFRLPFIGWNMHLNEYIPLKRGDKESIREMLEKCRKTLKKGNSVFIFPEGTRSETGILRPFKLGAFQLAHELQLPILPIAIDGTREVLPKYSLELKSTKPMNIQIMPPVPYENFQHMSEEETAAFFRKKIGAHVTAHTEDTEEPSLLTAV